MSKKVLFSLEDVDFNHDASINAFAQRVWAQATVAFLQEANEQSAGNEGAHGPGNPGGLPPMTRAEPNPESPREMNQQ